MASPQAENWKDISIGNLPHKTTEKLKLIFDPPGPLDWRELVVNLPGKHTYQTREVREIEQWAKRKGTSVTEELLGNLEKRGFTPEDLQQACKGMGHRQALTIITDGLKIYQRQLELFKKSLEEQQPEKDWKLEGKPIQVSPEQVDEEQAKTFDGGVIREYQDASPSWHSLLLGAVELCSTTMCTIM